MTDKTPPTPEWEERQVQVVTHATLYNLADELAFQLARDDILNFILKLDENVAEVEFTQELILRLNETLIEDDRIETVDNTPNVKAALNRVLAAIHELDQAVNG